ncbi:MAG: penicillin-binding protein 1C [Saprospiraceae bacterium]|nr:penicillin-binding protein 1C [Saprospiraceae bacterium]
MLTRLRLFHTFFFQTHRRKTGIATVVLVTAFWFCLPQPLFDDPTSMVLEDKNGDLLGARIAADGQWRFPATQALPSTFTAALIEFEDRHFYRHAGINPLAFVRAMGQNIKNQRVVSGGSTLTMQTIRLARQNKPRSIFTKFVEAFMATRLEMTYSKAEILGLYAAHAPFGGNVVGIEAASWRYFGKNPKDLSWAESVTLAVLPNAPSLINPSKNRQALFNKRNRLLERLIEKGVLDRTTGELAKEEPLPDAPLALPQAAPHLLDRAFKEQIFKTGKQSRVRTTIDFAVQKQVASILKLHYNALINNGVHNLAAMVMNVETGNVVAYCGNVAGAGKEHGEDVDIITALRSTGSIMKPFLYAFAQQEGEILPNSMLLDIPTEMGGYHPENFAETYDGVIPARRALARSLNIPFVRLLNQYGVEKFYHQLPKLGINTFNKSPDHYGLTMILGGGESSLWQLSSAYAGMARTAKHWYTLDHKYSRDDWKSPNYLFKKEPKNNLTTIVSDIQNQKSEIATHPVYSAAAAWLTLDAMKEVERPDAEGSWQLFENTKTIAWKTGTSFGFRDAWAIGVTPQYVVGVWVGNADGEGRPGVIGLEAAAPVLFDIFNALPTKNEWFDAPYDDMKQIEVCRQSGYRATKLCEKDTVWASKAGEKVKACAFHQTIHLDKTGQFQVTSECEEPQNMVHRAWFSLPPLVEYYYRTRNPNYQTPPPYKENCRTATSKTNPMQLIYPKSVTKIYLPIDFDGKPTQTIFRVAHRQVEATVFWHLDNEFVGSTKTFHQIALQPTVGKHRLTLVDENGNRLEQRFEIMTK